MSFSLVTKGNIFSLLVILALLAVLLLIEYCTSEVGAAASLVNGEMSDTQQLALTSLLDLINLFMNWSFAVVGATGFFLKYNLENNSNISKVDVIISFSIVLLAVSSLFLGHLALDKCSVLLSLDQYPLDDDTFRILGRSHYLVGIGAITLFGFQVFQFFWRRVE